MSNSDPQSHSHISSARVANVDHIGQCRLEDFHHHGKFLLQTHTHTYPSLKEHRK